MALPVLKQTLIDAPAEHFNLLHTPNQHGTVLIWEKGRTRGHWQKLPPNSPFIPGFLSAQAGQEDRFLTVNEFFSWRVVRNLKSLRALYVDIDGSTDLAQAEELLFYARLPSPSFVVFSGRGMHLYWLHQPVPAQALPVWQRCQDELISALQPLGADPSAKDCARVLRLVGSINSKNQAPVRGLIFNSEPLEFRHLCNEILGYRENRGRIVDLSTVKAHRRERVHTGSIYDRWHLVYRDLLTIADWYLLGGIPEGHRNNWLYLSAVALSWFAHPATLADELGKQAKAWAPNLSAKEVKSAIHAPLERAKLAAEGHTLTWQGKEVDPRYRYRRSTLFELLAPIIPGELAPQLRAIVSDEVRKAHKKENNREQEKTREARDRVLEGRWKSHKVGAPIQENSTEQQKPWEKLGISRRTYYNRKAAGEVL